MFWFCVNPNYGDTNQLNMFKICNKSSLSCHDLREDVFCLN